MEIEGISSSDFDLWAESYDRDVLDETHFPFIGYQQALRTVAQLSEAQPRMNVLDLGTGTGNLAALFSAANCTVWACDFSAAMLAKAKHKLSEVKFIQADIRNGWPAGIPAFFDRIVSAYVFHHFNLVEKVRICGSLIGHLAGGGKLILADIAFRDQETMELFKMATEGEWEDEFYWLADEAINALQQVEVKSEFIPVSPCAGVFVVELP